MTVWHVLTGEYPPQLGGVSDHTRQIARGLSSAGDDVHVWAPPCGDADIQERGILVHRLPDRFGSRSLQVLDREIDTRPASRVLVQYVPQAFGRKGANVPFCWWLRSKRRHAVWVMFHEVAYPFGETISRTALAAVNRIMASLVSRSAERVFISIPAWRTQLRGCVRGGTPLEWLPVPSGVTVADDDAGTARIRTQYAAGRPLVGHFGSCGAHIQTTLIDALSVLLRIGPSSVLLVGRDSDAVATALAGRSPEYRGRVHAAGILNDADVSRHISACDVMLQPYADGISSRRTSAMAALAHGRPIVTTRGWLTEPLWAETGAVELVEAGDATALAHTAAAVLTDQSRRQRLSATARAVYGARFDLRHTIAALRSVETTRRCAS
jgi:glycosyltransferase involved in cell wall biosynthesis